MRAWNVIPAEEFNPWMDDFVNIPCPGGLFYIDLFERAKDFYYDIKVKHAQEKIVWFIHAGFIRAFKVLAEEVPLVETFERIKAIYGDVRAWSTPYC